MNPDGKNYNGEVYNGQVFNGKVKRILEKNQRDIKRGRPVLAPGEDREEVLRNLRRQIADTRVTKPIRGSSTGSGQNQGQDLEKWITEKEKQVPHDNTNDGKKVEFDEKKGAPTLANKIKGFFR